MMTIGVGSVPPAGVSATTGAIAARGGWAVIGMVDDISQFSRDDHAQPVKRSHGILEQRYGGGTHSRSGCRGWRQVLPPNERKRLLLRAPVKRKYACPCCGFLTLSNEPPGTYGLCPVCFWEDDGVQFQNPNYAGGANRDSLNTARANF